MALTSESSWVAANQHYLSMALDRVRRQLQRQIARVSDSLAEAALLDDGATEFDDVRRDLPLPPALDSISEYFQLSPFERDLLVLCAGMELDSTFPQLCAAAHNDSSKPFPTFGLALATLDGAHWSALTPAGPLRRWHLVEVLPGGTLTSSALRIDERILHHLVGLQHLDERLVGIVSPVVDSAPLPESVGRVVQRVVTLWSRHAAGRMLPAVQLTGARDTSKRALAADVSRQLGLNLHLAYAHGLPTLATDIESLAKAWEREAVLSSSALYLDCEDLDSAEPVRLNGVTHLIERIHGPLFVGTRDPLRLRSRPAFTVDVPKPQRYEQRAAWSAALDSVAPELNGNLDLLVAQFDLDVAAIESASREALARASEVDAPDLGALLWDASRRLTRPRLEDLAQRIEPAASWDDLVLPAPQRQMLREVAIHVRQRATVFETWGFASKGSRGSGLSALFAGASGTGKTMAAEVLANELELDLFRIDLSSVVSKYIGETEKNLRRVFDAAEEGGAILLFDEADALFGKRSEVKDSHDRYANIEVSYLLQRMEAYGGLAILTTNLKNALDTAFLRRIRFVVQFPFPDGAQRAEIWRRVFPRETPTRGLDFDKLSRLNVAGGNIRNIALNAAFLAAEAESPVSMTHLLRAARTEYAKLEKPLTDAEIRGWV